MKTITIPAPKFDLYELVTLYWYEKTLETRIPSAGTTWMMKADCMR